MYKPHFITVHVKAVEMFQSDQKVIIHIFATCVYVLNVFVCFVFYCFYFILFFYFFLLLFCICQSVLWISVPVVCRTS